MLLIALIVAVCSFVVPKPTRALTDDQMYFHAVNGIFIYDPGDKYPFAPIDTCTVDSNGIYKGEQYILTEEEMKALARAAMNENNCNLTAFKNEISLMANLYERRKDKYSSIVEYVAKGGWFAGSTVKALKDTARDVPKDRVQAVKDVLVNGNRTLPYQIVEHDCFGDLEWLVLDGVTYYGDTNGGCAGDSSTPVFNKALYVKNKTAIHNFYGATYIFYTWAGGGEPCYPEDPFGYYANDPPSESYSTIADANNVNYAGAEVWSSADLQAIEANKSFYEAAAKKYGFPWQILAVIHYRENSLLRSNAESGKGAYGISNGETFAPVGAIDDGEFKRQTDIVAGMVADNIKAAGMNSKDLSDEDAQKIFYFYSGISAKYEEKGKELGLTEEQIASGGGSPYVMNRYDARRDPTSSEMSPYWPGMFTQDGAYNSESVDLKFGAFVLYQALTGELECESFGDTIADAAMLLSWEGLNSHDKDDPKPEYTEAMKAVGTDGRGNGFYPEGASCDQFVATVVRYSGADENFPVWGPKAQRDYMASRPSMYEKVDISGGYNVLQPGDIFVTTNAGAHIYIYVGVIDGEMTQASASADERTGEHFSGAGAVYFSDNGTTSNGGQTRQYEVYRRIGYY